MLCFIIRGGLGRVAAMDAQTEMRHGRNHNTSLTPEHIAYFSED